MFSYDNGKNIYFNEKKKILLNVYKDSGWIVKKVLENIPEEKILFFDNLEQIRMPNWSKGRVVLVGDACACLTLIAGQGASMAMLEAYVLADGLNGERLEYSKAFRAYELLLKPDIEKRQMHAINMAENFVPSTRFSLFFNRWINRFLSVAFSLNEQ